MCRIHTFSVAFTTDFAVGALCAIAVERLLVVAFPHKANSLVTLTSVSLGMTSFGVTVVIKNLLHFWMMGPFQATEPGRNQSTSENFTEVNLPQLSASEFRCKPSKDYDHLFKLFTKLDLISFAVLPYVILFTSNVYIYVKLRKQQAILRKSRPHIASIANAGLPGKTVTGLKPARHAKETAELQNFKKSTQALDVQPNKRAKRRPDGVIKLLTALTLIHKIKCSHLRLQMGRGKSRFTMCTKINRDRVLAREPSCQTLSSTLQQPDGLLHPRAHIASAARSSFTGGLQCKLNWEKLVFAPPGRHIVTHFAVV
ncbi:uncharacterized protein DEA37_0000732 [Paragonimus westermani]|uniref:G-protein coupled receptors family 1 profile domain-containing protein n=1 Tax=Paragonimus westermani TaxID=34504 RepID=A0A5J4NPB1_9TREM|nr:uncharacterized protein DEA37_0000732 [Paragonimus westermani]